MMNCTKCGQPVDWTPHKVSGRLILTARCCGVGQTAEADFVVTVIREGLRLIRPVD
jgi:hypothetical protein|tara:strand:+ start:3843 stop:4010 length:168 start_codon:yes stop_codon:yes gene_type:complete